MNALKCSKFSGTAIAELYPYLSNAMNHLQYRYLARCSNNLLQDRVPGNNPTSGLD